MNTHFDRFRPMARRQTLASAVALTLLGGLFTAAPGRAQTPMTEAQQTAAILSLQQTVAGLQSTVSSQAAAIQTLQSQKAVASTATTTTTYGPFTVTGNDVYLTGYNLHIQSGSGTTYGAINGKGNLIIGYNEGRGGGADNRTGSHNLILGTRNNFSGYGGLVAGAQNGITGGYTTITGGYGNRAVGTYSSVSGGQGSTATAAYDLEPEAPAVTSLQTQVTALGSTQSAQGKITGLFSLSTDGTRTDGKASTELALTGVNLHLVDGSGSTGSTSGLGNLIIGYDGAGNPKGDVRTGSHNLILGDKNSYASFGGLIAGSGNTISGVYASVTGGYGNTASDFYSSVSGGNGNVASGALSSVSGGFQNTASGPDASVSGGYANTAAGGEASVCGGSGNTAAGNFSIAPLDALQGAVGLLQQKTAPLSLSGTDLTFTGVNVHVVSGSGSTSDGTMDAGDNPIAGTSLTGLGNLIIGYDGAGNTTGDVRTGSHNLILGDKNSYSSFGGLVAGSGNAISNFYASVTGGYGNTANGFSASVGGGYGNTASGASASISGGESNTASGLFASISGGFQNTTSGSSASVSGGYGNTAGSFCASIGGGYNLTQDTLYGWSAGN